MPQWSEERRSESANALSGFRAPPLFSRMGIVASRSMYWFYKEADGINFGDWIGPYLFEKIKGKQPFFHDPRRGSIGSYFLGCGSILGHIRQPHRAAVWGSGAIKADSKFPAPKKVYAVRGPLSRKLCLDYGYPCPPMYGDPGILMPRFYKPTPRQQRYSLGIVPHFKDWQLAKSLFGDRDDLLIIDVRRSVEAVIDDMMSCETVVSSSLHGVIIAQAYGLPAAWAILSDNVIGGGFKFADYFLGVGFAQPQRPIIIDAESPQTTKELNSAAVSAGQIDLSSVADRLLAVCPF